MPVAVQTVPSAPRSMLMFIVLLAVLLLCARLLGRLAERIGLTRTAGELFTGVVVGPSVLGAVAPGVQNWLLPVGGDRVHLLDAFAQLGVLLLVGITGTHVDGGLLRRRARVAVTVSAGGLLVPLGLGFGLGLLLPATTKSDAGFDRWISALFLGVAMGVSAIPVIAKTLSDLGLLHRDISQLTLIAGTLDDAAAWFLLSMVSAAATGSGMGHAWLTLVYLFAFAAFSATVGRVLVRRTMRLAGRTGRAEPTVAAAVVLMLGAAALTQALGLEAILGAFVAGILVGAPGAADRSRLAPLGTVVMAVLAPLFLAAAGLRIDLRALVDRQIALAALAILVVAVVGKFAGAYLGARISGLRPYEGFALGAGLNVRGVVGIIVALTGLRLGVLTTATYTIIVLVALATSAMAPPLLRHTMAPVPETDEERLRRLDQTRATHHDPDGVDRGCVGQRCAGQGCVHGPRSARGPATGGGTP